MFVGPTLTIAPLMLAVKLFAILAGAAVVGSSLRWVVGRAVIARHKDRIDGLNVLALFVFVAAVMGGVGAHVRKAPIVTLALVALAFAVFFAVLLLTVLLFVPAGRGRALALGFMASGWSLVRS